MSGGSFNYEYRRFEETYSGHMEDLEMNQLIIDLAKVLHDLEWYTSGDTCEDTYKRSVTAFKEQWFQGSAKVRSVVAEKLRGLAEEIAKEESENGR